MIAQVFLLAVLILVFLYGVSHLALTVGSTVLSQIREFEGRFSVFVLGAIFYVASCIGAILTTSATFLPETDFIAFEQAHNSMLFLEWFFAAGVAFGLYSLFRRPLEKFWYHRRRLAVPAAQIVTPMPYALALAPTGAPTSASGRTSHSSRPSLFLPRPNRLARIRTKSAHLPFRRKTILAELPFNQVYHLEVVEFDLDIPSLPAEFDGLKIAHLTDFHFTPEFDRAYYEHCMDLALRWQPDLMAITGDYVSKVEHFGYGMEWLSRLRAPLGVFAVRGNHDFWHQPDEIAGMLAANGATLLDNRALTIERGGAAIVLAGVDHPWLPLRRGSDFTFPAGPACRILLSHTPDNFPWAARRGFSLVLSGHTHGGQVRLPVLGSPVVASRYGQRYAAGLFRKQDSYLYVSKGLGCSVPLRINCTPEVTLFRLRSRPSIARS